ncbi:MAG: cytochrome c oxidase assembly protein, partial [Hyphomicrobiales bacterium]
MGKTMASDQPAGTARLNQRMAVLCLVVFAAVLAAIYAYATSASAPAHRRADAPDASRILDRRITVRLDANTGAGMPWQFKPVEKNVTVRLGEKQTVYYRATNNTAQTITGTARFSVTPIEAAGYFKRVDCFCFTDQRVEAGQTVDMAV